MKYPWRLFIYDDIVYVLQNTKKRRKNIFIFYYMYGYKQKNYHKNHTQQYTNKFSIDYLTSRVKYIAKKNINLNLAVNT